MWSFFTDLKLDFEKKNYWYIIYDIIGLIGILLIFGTYVFYFYYILKHKMIKISTYILFYLRYLGFILIFLYAYLRKDYEGNSILINIIILTIIYYFSVKFFT